MKRGQLRKRARRAEDASRDVEGAGETPEVEPAESESGESASDSAAEAAEELQSEEEEDAHEHAEGVTRKTASDPRFALPTKEEQDHLRQTRNLFKSNLLKLEMDELLNQVRVDPDQATRESLRGALVSIKRCLEGVKPVATLSAASVGAQVSGWEGPAEAVELEAFGPPERVDVVGSFMLDTMTKPDRVIDMAVTMPAACFKRKDYLNRRYHDKRLIYLGGLAMALQGLDEVVRSAELVGFAGASDKPALQLRLVGARGSLLSKFAVRILPVLAEDVFPPGRFHPMQNNVRALSHFGANDASPDAESFGTPRYNMSILEDMPSSSFRSQLAVLHAVKEACPSFAPTTVLLKVWARVRGLDKARSPDAFHGGLLCILLAHLVLDRRVNPNMSVQQMFRSFLGFLAELPDRAVLRMRPTFNAEPAIHDGFGDEALLKSFEVVFVGPCGRLNLAWRVSKAELATLKTEAAKSHALLESSGKKRDGGRDLFGALFTTKADLWQQFDKYFAVRVPRVMPSAASPVPSGCAEMVCDMGWDMFTRRRTEQVFERAFVETKRATTLRVIASGENALSIPQFVSPASKKSGSKKKGASDTGADVVFLVCLRLDLVNAFRLIDKGPSAEDAKAAATFRAFWGAEKAELRRFQDGSILETLDWTTSAETGTLDVCEAIAEHIIVLHWPFVAKAKGAARVSVGKELDDALRVLDLEQARRTLQPAAEDGGFRDVMVVFDGLVSRLRKLDLPLTITNVVANSAALRYASAVQPAVHPFAFGRRDSKRNAALRSVQQRQSSDEPSTKRRKGDSVRVSRAVEAIEAVVQVESSGQWPDDLDAISAMKTAFYVQICERLEREAPGMQRCIPARSCVEILVSGFAFRLTLRLDKELSLMRSPRMAFLGSVSRAAARKLQEKASLPTESDEKSSAAILAERAAHVERSLIRKPLLHMHLHAVHTSGESTGGARVMSPVVRLAKLWVSGHCLWPHICEEAIELLVATVFLHPQPLEAPRSAASGFMRFLALLATWDWENEPLLVGVGDGFAAEARSSVLKAFMDSRDRASGPHMYIVTPDDASSGWKPYWTSRSQPAAAALDRMQTLARDSLRLLESLLAMQAAGSYDGRTMGGLWTAAFQSAADDGFFDFVLRLHPRRVLHEANLSSSSDAKVYKNLAVEEKVYVGANPVESYAADLEQAFGHVFQVYVDPFRGTEVGLRWQDGVKAPAPARVAVVGGSMPFENHEPSKGKSGAFSVVPNVAEILADVVDLGFGMVTSVSHSPSALSL